MDFHPDVLERLGKIPRELGALHLHVEAVVRRENGQATARVWLQAAFSPLAPRPLLRVLDQTFSLPELVEGQVMRGELPLSVPAGVTELLFAVESPVLERAGRVRQAWKLLDTIEVAKERDLKTASVPTGSAGGLLFANALSLPMGVAVVPIGAFGPRVDPGMSAALAQRVHKAKEGPGGYVARVVGGQASLVTTETWTEVWRPGAPLPEPVEAEAPEYQSALEERVATAPAERFEAPAPGPGESPWALAQSLLALGFPKVRIIERLVTEKGLSAKDAELLLADVPEPAVAAPLEGSAEPPSADTVVQSGVNLGPLLGAGMVILGMVLVVVGAAVLKVAGLVFFVGGLVRAGSSFGESPKPPVVDKASLAPLPDDSTVQRCGVHPRLASLGACSRCGAFACRACAPWADFPASAVCLACDALPATRQERLTKTQHTTALVVAGYAVPSLAVAGLLAADGVPWRAVVMVLLVGAAAQALVLAGLQWVLGHAWPGLLSLGTSFLALVLIVPTLFGARAEGSGVLLVLSWLGLSVAVFTLASQVQGRRKALAEASAQLAAARTPA